MKIIGEIGINFESCKDIEKLITEAAKAGVDGVKLQYFRSEMMYPPKQIYKDEDINKVLKDHELKNSWLPKIRKLTKDLDILFVCTVCVPEHVKIVEPYVDILKVASSESNYIQLHRELNETRKPVVISTGATKFNELYSLVSIYTKNRDITLLYCNYMYPTKVENVNLNKLNRLKRLKTKVGFSDHTEEINTAIMAVAFGCDYYEKHITLSKEAEGLDHFFSTEMSNLKKICEQVRNAKTILGNERKETLEEENELRAFAYRKVFASQDIPLGTIINKKMLSILRNGNSEKDGFNPNEIEKIIGKMSKNAINKFNVIGKDDIWI